MSYPLISELPALLDTAGWTWQIIQRPDHASDGFWIGTDRDGRNWLTKLRGSSYAYREIVFAKIAQHLNWSCQSSIFIRLDVESAKILGRKRGEVHAAHWYFHEHLHALCTIECPLPNPFCRYFYTIESFLTTRVRHIIDWPKSELAAYIFGANESPEPLFTVDHELVIIDSEQMFSSGPSSFENLSWLKRPDGSRSQSGHELAMDVCAEVCSLSEEFITNALLIPKEIDIELRWSLEARVHKSIEFAKAYLQGRGEV